MLHKYSCVLTAISISIGLLSSKMHSRADTPQDGKVDLIAESYSILAMWKNHFSQLLYIHGFNDVRKKKIHTAEPLVPEPSALKLRWLLKS
jgi:hypothetical protein